MSKTPTNSSVPSFSPKVGSYKRRSLQSPFILNDSAPASEDEHEKQDLRLNLDEEDMNGSFSFEKPVIPQLSISNMNQNGSPELNYGSLMSESPSFKANKRHSMPAGRSHKRNTSIASMTYTPPVMPNLPPTPTNSSPQQPSQPFKFTSMNLNNNSSESLLIPEGNQTHTLPGQQILPKANYRRGHRYKHSSVSMNMFQDPVRLASMTQPKLPEKYPIPSRGEIMSMITPSQKKRIVVFLVQGIAVLMSYFFGFRYSNSCLSTLAHILFYDVISNFSNMSVQVMSNFDVWRLSSLQYPFGLGRIEVLFGFALAVSLLFVGLDLISHITEEFLITSIIGDQGSHGHGHQHGHSEASHEATMNPLLYEIFVLGCIFITIFTSHFINEQVTENKVETVPSVKRISSITLNEPLREGPWDRIKYRFNLKTNILYNSTTGLSLIYGLYCLYYPFAQGLFKLHSVGRILHQLGIVSGDLVDETDVADGHDHVDDAIEATEWINHSSTVLMAILVSWVAWKLIWKLGNILILASPSINYTDEALNNVEKLIESNVAQLEVYKSSYSIEEVKVARMNTRVYVVIMKVNMPGASDDDESKFRFYTMRIIRGLMYQTVKGHLHNKGLAEKEVNEEKLQEDNRRSLIDLLNLSTSIESFEGIDKLGDQFEITIDINRL